MKKLFAISLAVVFIVLCLVGCNSQPKESNPSPSPAAEEISSGPQRQDIVVKEYGFSADEYGKTHYGVIIENPNDQYAAERFQVSITARDADGKILGTDTANPRYLFPLQTTAIAGPIQTTTAPDSIEVKVSINDSSWKVDDSIQGGDVDTAYHVENLAEIDKGYGMVSVTGEVFNDSGADAEQMIVNLIMRDADGKIVYGDYDYVKTRVPAGDSSAFEFNCFDLPEHAVIEAYTMVYM